MFRIYEDDNKVWFEDELFKFELSEYVSENDIYYDEYKGYFLPDGRNLFDIVIEDWIRNSEHYKTVAEIKDVNCVCL